MQVSVHDKSGEIVDQVALAEYTFGVPFNEAVVHQAMVRQLANARLGTADTRTRGEVAGSTRKLFRQKHTGLARRGSIKSPLLRGGGVVFGPHPRSYRQSMPKKMRQLALRCLLSAKARDGELVVVDQFQLEQPKAKEIVRMLAALKVSGSVLIVTDEPQIDVIKAARNLPRVKTSPAALLNVVDLLSHRTIVMTQAAVHKVEQIWGKQASLR